MSLLLGTEHTASHHCMIATVHISKLYTVYKPTSAGLRANNVNESNSTLSSGSVQHSIGTSKMAMLHLCSQAVPALVATPKVTVSAVGYFPLTPPIRSNTAHPNRIVQCFLSRLRHILVRVQIILPLGAGLAEIVWDSVCISALVITNLAQTHTKMSLEPENQSISVRRLWGGTCWFFTIARKCTRAICRIAANSHGPYTMILLCSPKRWNWMESCSNFIWPKMEDEAAPFYAVAPWYTFYPIHWHYNVKR